jgi:hypothetical protein
MVYAVAEDDPKATAAKALDQFAQGEGSGLSEFLGSLVIRGLERDPRAPPRMAEFLGQIEQRNSAILAGADAAGQAYLRCFVIGLCRECDLKGNSLGPA